MMQGRNKLHDHKFPMTNESVCGKAEANQKHEWESRTNEKWDAKALDSALDSDDGILRCVGGNVTGCVM